VRFHWDRAQIDDDRASCWMRVAQLQTSGSMALPRVNWEVLVEFLEGNPDRPVVTGRLYNGQYMPPYALPGGATRTSLKTASTPGGGGTNEIRFEDKAGSEEILIGSQYDTSIVAANNRTTKVGNNETQTIGSDCTLTVGVNQEVAVTNGHKCKIGGAQKITVGVNRSVEVNAVTGLTVAGSATTMVGALQFEMVGNPLAGLISVAKAKAAAAIEAKINEAIEKVKGKVQDKVDQVMGPINDLAKKVESVGGAMEALADGDLSAIVPLGQAAGALSDSDAAMANMGFDMAAGGESGSASGKDRPYSDPGGFVGASKELDGMIGDAIGKAEEGAKGAAKDAAASALDAAQGAANSLANDIMSAVTGREAAGGGGGSAGNRSGPAGDVDGVSQEDVAAGPGHNKYTVTGTHTETTGAVRVSAALVDINLNVTGAMTQKVIGALVEVVKGDYSEVTKSSKAETAALFGVFCKGSESETTTQGALNYMVGGAMIDKIKGKYTIEASSPATFIGALHKVTAKSAITLKCGGSSVVIDGGGVTITSASVNIAALGIKLTKAVAQN
jgi:type VI secretion system secreted protein VgrG